jgi:ABC-type sugar transport system permease subunit
MNTSGMALPRLNNVRKNYWRKALFAYALLLPTIFFVVGILGYGVISAFITSLHRVEALSLETPFVGVENYIKLFLNPNFRNSFNRSLVFVFSSVFLGTVLALTASLSLYRIKFLRSTLQSISLIPYLVSGISAAVSWRFLFSGTDSLINMIFEMLGGQALSWLGNPTRAMLVVILANVWKIVPFSTLILLSGLQSIDPDIFDAAAIDGAVGVRKFRHVTLPLIAPMMGVSVIWLNFASFNMFDLIIAMTGGGPGRATDLLAVHLYKLAFERLDFSTASAVMIILLFINVGVSIFSLKMSKV